MRYTVRPQKRRWPRRVFFIALMGIMVIIAATVITRQIYHRELGPANANNQQMQMVTISSGASADEIANQLQHLGIIHSAWAFELYVSSLEERSSLEAGTYSFSPSETVQEIVAQLSHGKVTANLVTILPGQRLNQIESTFKNDGFDASQVNAAFSNPTQYDNEAIMSIVPTSNVSLEGILFPNSYQKVSTTLPQEIVRDSLEEMNKQLTPAIRQAFSTEGLTPYQGVVLASIVEQEVSTQSDRNQVAQIFLSRLSQGMALGSDVTAYYGSIAAGQSPSVHFDSPYNTLLHPGLPPTPIGTISESSLDAVAHPAKTQWLYFVTGDNGTTYFSKTLAQHEAFTRQYCHKLCSE